MLNIGHANVGVPFWVLSRISRICAFVVQLADVHRNAAANESTSRNTVDQKSRPVRLGRWAGSHGSRICGARSSLRGRGRGLIQARVSTPHRQGTVS